MIVVCTQALQACCRPQAIRPALLSMSLPLTNRIKQGGAVLMEAPRAQLSPAMRTRRIDVATNGDHDDAEPASDES